MKFICLLKNENTPDKNILKGEFSGALRAGESRLGSRHFFYRYFINVKYISYEKIKMAYLREESGEVGEFLLKEFYLVLCFDNEEQKKLRFEREANARTVLAYLEEHYPHIAVGYKKGKL
ncbi:MAG: hypothetical protein NC231_07305 [Bacillus sp. (in: Bacteria)]|nr:hypothetical protein [Bacillus sp. (in: firmicutes)]MCM1426469.1 hypothetical protein [Eubacterium sp.]